MSSSSRSPTCPSCSIDRPPSVSSLDRPIVAATAATLLTVAALSMLAPDTVAAQLVVAAVGAFVALPLWYVAAGWLLAGPTE